MIIQDDCLTGLDAVSDDSVDLIMTSPPYALARSNTYGGTPADLYVEWFIPRAKELYRTLNPTGSFILNIKENAANGERATYVLELVLALKKQGWLWVEEYIWHKKHAFPGKWKYRFRDAWEHVFHFAKSKEFKMYQDAVMIPAGDWTKNRLNNLSEEDKKRHYSNSGSGHTRKVSNWKGRTMAYPSNVLHGAPLAHNVGHPAAFPQWLPEFFIKLFTVPGDIVLDPFAGSGTTYAAAKQLGRFPIAIETNPAYINLIKKHTIQEVLH